jgi:hypothetical protein
MIKKLSEFIQWAISRFAPKHDEIDFWPFPVDEKVKQKQVKKVTVPKATTRPAVKKAGNVAKKAAPKKKVKAK